MSEQYYQGIWPLAKTLSISRKLVIKAACVVDKWVYSLFLLGILDLGGCVSWAHYRLQIGEHYTMPTLCAKPPASCLADCARAGGTPARQAVFVIWHPAILEATPSGLQLSKSALHLQPTTAGTAWRGSFARPANPSHPCKSTETSVVWGGINLAAREKLEERERNEIKLCGQETNQNVCQKKVTDFLTAISLCLKAPLQYLYSVLVMDGS